MRTATVHLIDDEPSVLRSLERLLTIEGYKVASWSSPAEFLVHYDPEAPGCMVADLAMPGADGLQLQAALNARGCDPAIVFLTGHGDVSASVRAMRAGAVTFLAKPVHQADLIAAIEEALARDEAARFTRLLRREIQARLSALTHREREVFERVIVGKLNKQIAAELGTAEKTVKVHRARVMNKMRARSVAELVRLAAEIPATSRPALRLLSTGI